MTGPIDELGPVDYRVVEFPGSQFNGGILVAATADALEPGSTAALLVYENIWAAPLASAVRRSGGQLVASGRIPVQLLAVLEDELAEEIAEELVAEADSRS